MSSAVVHEWLVVPGGSEKVTFRLLDLLRGSDLYASVYRPDAFPELAGRQVRTTFLDRLPGARSHFRKLLPLMTLGFEQLDLSGYELVVSSSHSCAKNVVTPPETLHLCYCHTPMRYAWEPDKAEGEPSGPAGRIVLPLLLSHLRRVDLGGAARVDRFVANSQHVASRIRKYYRRDAVVVYPPVDVEPFLRVERSPSDAYLVVSRLVPYKRVELAIAACNRLGRRLLVVGEGRSRERLEALAGSDVSFLGRVPDARLAQLMASCRGLIFPGVEDFGMVPVEAQAAGAPVIAYARGGALETVVEGETGTFFGAQTTEALCDALERFEAMKLDPDEARRNSLRFEPARFDRELWRAIELGAETSEERAMEPSHA